VKIMTALGDKIYLIKKRLGMIKTLKFYLSCFCIKVLVNLF
jgi:hypothetical protein